MPKRIREASNGKTSLETQVTKGHSDVLSSSRLLSQFLPKDLTVQNLTVGGKGQAGGHSVCTSHEMVGSQLYG